VRGKPGPFNRAFPAGSRSERNFKDSIPRIGLKECLKNRFLEILLISGKGATGGSQMSLKFQGLDSKDCLNESLKSTP
jgi:hypothetical protein